MKKATANGKDKLEPIAYLCILATVFIGLLVTLGWLFGLRLITSISPQFIPMAPATAVSFFIFSCALIIFHKKPGSGLAKFLTIVLSLMVFLAALMILLEFFGVIRMDIENFFVGHPKMFHGRYEGHMSSLTAFNFLFLSVCLFIPSLRRQMPRIIRLGIQGCVVLVFLSSLFIFLSYLYGAPFLYGTLLIPMGLNTSIVFMFISVAAMILIDRDVNPLRIFSENTIKARLLRAFLPTMVGIIIIEELLEVKLGFSPHDETLTSSLRIVLFLVIGWLVLVKITKNLDSELNTLMAERDVSRRQFENIFNLSVDIIIVADMKGRFVKVNPAFKNVLGYAQEETIGKSFAEFVHPDNRAASIHLLESCLGKGSSLFNYVDRYCSKDGACKFIEWTAVSDMKNSLIYALGRDITESTLLQEKLKEKNQFIESIVELTPAVHYIYDLVERRNVYVNNGIEKVLGYSIEEVQNNGDQFLANLMHPDDLKIDFQNNLLKYSKMKDNEIFHHEYRMRDKIGRWHWLDCNEIIYTRQADGAPARIFGTVYDVTSRKEMEQRLGKRKVLLERIVKRKTRMLQKAQKDIEDSRRLSDIGTLAATVAHELRNPLGVIKTAVYNLKNKVNAPALESNFANIDKKISESDTIIRNLLSYAKISKPRFEKLSCHEILNECLEAVNHKYIDWNVAVKIDCNCAHNDFITADRFQLTELYSNLLDNAYQALPDKQGTIEINARFDKDKNTFTIIFKDNGIGMNEYVLEKACEPFFTTKSRGIGLGLTVCKQIVNLHAGQLYFVSDGKSGTAATITLPIRN